MHARNGTPFELWYGRKPDLSHLRVWGCRAYVQVQRDKRSKLDSHMVPCVFIGYPSDYKGWRFYDPASCRVLICKRAIFDELYFPLGNLSASRPSFAPPSPDSLSLDPADGVSLTPDAGEADEPEGSLRPVVSTRRQQHSPNLRPLRDDHGSDRLAPRSAGSLDDDDAKSQPHARLARPVDAWSTWCSNSWS